MDAYRVTPEQVEKYDERFGADVAYAIKSETHLWLAMASFKLSDETAKGIASDTPGIEPMFDHETLRNVAFGCYICEQGLSRRLVGRRCPGEPKH